MRKEIGRERERERDRERDREREKERETEREGGGRNTLSELRSNVAQGVTQLPTRHSCSL